MAVKMFKTAVLVLSVLGLIQSGVAQIVSDGQCEPNINLVPNFNATGYLGRWFLVESYPNRFQSGDCIDATYSLGANGVVNVLNSQVVNETLSTISGTAVAVDGTGLLLVTFPSAPEPAEYHILTTDYISYALVYSCTNVSSTQRSISSWKLSRTRSLTPTAITSINAVVNTVDGLNNTLYEVVDHSPESCFYFPAPALGTPVRLRGTCGQGITPVQNFNSTAYLGVWYLAESYPSVFQTGQCNRQVYTAATNGFGVTNSQVTNQILGSISGSATVSADGSGILNVTFPLNPAREALLWVLATDYTSYSLIYSCSQEDDEYMQVTSWKMSRTRQLSAAAVTAINNATADIQVLDDRYYQPVNQSEESCFYFPEPQLGTPVRFRGTCGRGITPVQNFNSTAYLGVWYLAESYPSVFQTGQCNRQVYTAATNGFGVTNSQVTNQILGSISGSATVSADGSGILNVTFPLNPAREALLWVLATDYTSYSLIYSCSQEDDEYMQVTSWKMSRTRQLSAAAVTAINNATADIQVLDDRYYQPVNQSEESCFYFPEPELGTPVRFRGTCGRGITPVQNFNSTAYLGQWYLAESYPSRFQTGQCNRQVYTVGTNGYAVTNNQVTNQTLSSISGSATVSADGSGILNVTFPLNPVREAQLWVVATDYTSYSLIYSCTQEDDEYMQVTSWKMSRTRQLSAAAVTAINNATADIQVLDDRYYQPVNQSEESCFYFPEPQLGTPVRFRGTCGQGITPVQNFNSTAYLGTWYLAESYPSVFQTGQCNRQVYTETTNGFGVTNSQVTNQSLGSISGTASLSADGSGILNVTFPLNPIREASLWVLATDYTSYSLIYSCSQDDEYMQVTSWKMSRTGQLSAAAITAIDNVTADIQVLDDRYYQPVDQGEESCFYFPEPQLGTPVRFRGTCGEGITPVPNFNATAYLGLWYLAESYPSTFQTGQCNRAYYSETSGGFEVVNSQVINESLASITGSATVPADGSGRLNVTFPLNPVREAPLWVLATDYSSYSLIYSCTQEDDEYMQVTSWKLSRNTALSAAANNAINAVTENITVLDSRYFFPVDQSGDACFYYPEFDTPPASIVLPGPCNTNVRGVPNFNSVAYQGRWIEIERYPQPFQTGQCNRATYTTVGGMIDVTHAQVLNQNLVSQIGTAEIASTDGSGQLNVTFVLSSGTVNVANYYILATDYDSYALVYSCSNLADGNRQISSWKLSRTTTLSPAANNNINSVIATTQGLRQDLYRTTDQSEQACFYVPELNVNEPVRFRGSCPNLAGIPNFNMQSYLGWWNHINNYPTGQDTGTCLSTQYNQVGNQIEFVDTQVFGLTGQVTRGTVTDFANGRIRKTWNTGTQDVWVLATDYTSYSLVFTCEESEDGYVTVWSSMQSKTRTLSAAAETAITAAIANNNYLLRNFFLPVGQTNQECFHYPETTNQVVLPGQCDPNIPVQANFDIAGFAGTWYQIERYPYPNVSDSSTCIGTRLTYNADSGGVNVLNWEVINGELNTIEGEARVASNAVLETTLPVSGAENQNLTARLYILATDYTSYSLAYTCENLNQFERVVVAFKLSRDRTLSPAAFNAINSAMTPREELHQPLFISVSQSEDCEEPNSSFFIRSSTFVVLICYAINMLM